MPTDKGQLGAIGRPGKPSTLKNHCTVHLLGSELQILGRVYGHIRGPERCNGLSCPLWQRHKSLLSNTAIGLILFAA